MGRTIGVLSLKGGVGKTSIVSGLGAALAELGKKVLLVDANFSAPNLGVHFNFINPEKTLQQILRGEINSDDAVTNVNKFDAIFSSLYDKKETNVLKLKDKLKFLKRKYDIILIDSSPALNDETLAVMLASDGLLVATTPDFSTLSTTLKAVNSAKKRGFPVCGLVLNKVYNKKFEIGLEDIEHTTEVPVLAVIPHDLNVLKAQSKFISSVNHNPNSEASQEYKKLAATLVGEKHKPLKFKSFFRWVNPKRQDINRLVFYDRVFKEESKPL